jgi:hypothetical protein
MAIVKIKFLIECDIYSFNINCLFKVYLIPITLKKEKKNIILNYQLETANLSWLVRSNRND